MFITSIFDTASALFVAAGNLFQSTAQGNGDRRKAVILPGGNTPLPLFASMEKKPFPVSNAFYVGYTDERLVPVHDPANNYALSRGMLAALGVDGDRVMRVDTSLPGTDAADAYHDAWSAFLADGGVIPLAFLGLGGDGHTCSLFTEEQLRLCAPDRFAAHVPREAGPDRVTITPALLSRVAHCVILAVGSEKAAIVEAMTDTPDKIVAGIALAQCPRVSLWYAPHD